MTASSLYGVNKQIVIQTTLLISEIYLIYCILIIDWTIETLVKICYNAILAIYPALNTV